MKKKNKYRVLSPFRYRVNNLVIWVESKNMATIDLPAHAGEQLTRQEKVEIVLSNNSKPKGA